MKLDDIYSDLLEMVSKVGALVDVPIESEHFFVGIVESFQGSREELLVYIEANLKQWFRHICAAPSWLQEAEWQFDEGVPMVFLGQMIIPMEAQLFHDEAAAFVFLNPKNGRIKTVIQVA